MRTLYVNAVATFKKEFAYRISVIVAFLGALVGVYIQIVLWSFLYEDDLENATYMVAYVVTSNLISCFYEPNLAKRIEKRFRSGDLAIDLIRPANVSLIFWGEAIGIAMSKLVLRGLPVVFMFALCYRESFQLIQFQYTLLFIVVIAFSTIIHNSLFFSIGFLAIKVNAIWPYVRIVNDTIRLVSGSVIPISLFPTMLQTVINILPLKMLYSFPITLLLGNLSVDDIVSNIMLLFIWTALLMLLEKNAYKLLSKGISIQGG